ncbi:hypothetical protein PpBr36_04275, partial [Pyricularia pennisetigena]|uniref:hypothetical protein n=1 Tax=Pyricularia pennisetigena TaxID=1578925 RepID=UPI0011508066
LSNIIHHLCCDPAGRLEAFSSHDMKSEGLPLVSYVLGWVTCSISTSAFLCSLFATMRLVARYRGQGLSWDDGYLVFCVLVIFASKSVCHFAWLAGVGEEFSQIPSQDRQQAVFMSILATSIVPWEFTLPKLAIVVSIQAIIPTSKRRSRSWIAACGFCFALMLCISVWQFAQCRPVSQLWDPVPDGKCADARVNVALAYASSLVSCLIDLAICLYYVPVFLGLQMSAKNKATVIAALSFGALAFIVAMIKMVFLKNLAQLTVDPTGSNVALYILVDVESMMLMLGACMGSVIKLLKPKRRRGTKQTESSSC